MRPLSVEHYVARVPLFQNPPRRVLAPSPGLIAERVMASSIRAAHRVAKTLTTLTWPA